MDANSLLELHCLHSVDSARVIALLAATGCEIEMKLRKKMVELAISVGSVVGNLCKICWDGRTGGPGEDNKATAPSKGPAIQLVQGYLTKQKRKRKRRQERITKTRVLISLARAPWWNDVRCERCFGLEELNFNPFCPSQSLCLLPRHAEAELETTRPDVERSLTVSIRSTPYSM